MFLSVLTSVSETRIGRWLCTASLAVCLGLSGCAKLDLRGEKFPEDEMSRLTRQLREIDEEDQSFVGSNKAMQIDRNLGGPVKRSSLIFPPAPASPRR